MNQYTPEQEMANSAADKQALIGTLANMSAHVQSVVKAYGAACARAAVADYAAHHPECASVPEARAWITADSNTRSDIVSVLREEANEREQEDRKVGMFPDFAGAILLAAIADSLEADNLWSVAAPQPGQQT